MSKQEFLGALYNGLSGLPKEDIENSVQFYSEMIDDRMDEGMTENEAVEDIGSVNEIIQQILSESSLPKLVKRTVAYAFTSNANIFAMLVLIGGAFVCAGLSILSFFGINQITKGMVFVSKKIWIWIKSLFIRKEEVQ